MRILYINHYAGALQYGMEFRPFYLGREWQRMGHEVLVVGASYSHVRSSQPKVDAALAEEVVEGVPHIWLRTPPYPGNGFKRVRNMLAFVAGLYRFRRRFIDWAPDVVIASSTYPWDIYPASTIARRCHAQLVFEVHDLWPMSPMEIGGMSRWHPFIMALQHAEDYACRRADLVVSILPHTDKHLVTRGMPPERYHVVPNGIDFTEWETEAAGGMDSPARSLAESLRAQGKFVIGYAGSHGPGNALDLLLDAAHLLRDSRAAFVLVGGGPSKPALAKRATEEGLANVHFCEPVRKHAIPDVIRSFDCAFYGLAPSPLYAFGYGPNKIFDYMAAGVPIVQSVGAGNDLVRDADCGRTVQPGDAPALAAAIGEILDMSPAARRRLGENGRAFIRSHHDYRALARQFTAILGQEKARPAARPVAPSTVA